MTTLREAAQAALSALDNPSYPSFDAWIRTLEEARENLRVALAEPEPQPVAWMHTTGTGHRYFRKKPQDPVFTPQPVYTRPPMEWGQRSLEECDIRDAARYRFMRSYPIKTDLGIAMWTPDSLDEAVDKGMKDELA